MNRLQILTAAKATLATGAGQPDKQLAICFAIDQVAKPKDRPLAESIKTEIMGYLAPHLTFRSKLNANTATLQAARHAYIDTLIAKEAL